MYTPAMKKSTPYLYRDTLEKLAAEPTTTKTALVCSLLLEIIEGALRSGKTHKQIWQRLSDAGLDITCETFCRLIRRVRRKPRTSAARGGKSVEVPELHARQTATGVEHDPLANLRKVEASRPVFTSRYRKFGCPSAWKERISRAKQTLNAEESYRCLFSFVESAALAPCRMGAHR
jgi:predicted RNA-binding Zn-ribbon protein involved in translation (DUF1610 family)